MVCRGFWTHSSVCARVNERGTANSFSSLSEGIKKKNLWPVPKIHQPTTKTCRRITERFVDIALVKANRRKRFAGSISEIVELECIGGEQLKLFEPEDGMNDIGPGIENMRLTFFFYFILFIFLWK